MITEKVLRFLSVLTLFYTAVFADDDLGLVSINQGKLMGKQLKTVSNSATFYSFKGIPYAEPPIGELKFQPPVPHSGWEGVKKAFKHGNVCLQTQETSDEHIGGEDCLLLNVYTPSLKNEKIPVMFFIHGGLFRFGSGNDTFFGPDYFIDENVILVTINYRLGVLGFLDFENDIITGNMGMKDILLALKWVKNNIKSFGGDPDNITIFGQGSGGVAVDILYLSPIAKGLFHKAILQSGTGLLAAYFLWKPKERAYTLAERVGYKSSDDKSLLKVLNTIDPKIITGNLTSALDADETVYRQIGVVIFSPSLSTHGEETFITKLPEDIYESGEVVNPDIPIMIGFNSQESILHSWFFIQRPQFIKTLERRWPHLFPLRGLYAKFDHKIHYEIQYRLKWFYFNSTIDIHKETVLKEFLNYLSDEHVVPIDKSVKAYARLNTAPVYFYRFSYDGGFNYFKAKACKPIRDKLPEPVEGASEKDELCYLFKCQQLLNEYKALYKEEEESLDLKTIKRMVRLWTNFAKTGNPTPSEKDSVLGDLKWEPATASRQYFLDIDKELEVGLNPHFDNVDFWDAMYEYYLPLAVDEYLYDPVQNDTVKDEL